MKSKQLKPDLQPIIFISKTLLPDSPLLSGLASSGFEIIHESLIRVLPIRFSYSAKTNWIFFSSKNAIEHFFTQQPQVEPGTKYGVMGKSSAEYLLRYGIKADFIGSGIDTSQIGKDFAEVIKNETVLFPQAIDSLQTIQKHLSFNNISSNLYVYKTTLRSDFTLPPVKVLVFTSPSNVAAYFSKYKIFPGQKVVAMGSSTLRKLTDQGIKDAAIPASFDDEGLLNAILPHLIIS
ncbi:MAG: hydroxymethylbilane synthase [Bacteroidetes bacterium]|nr:hydroxymethylbilane synthase [Bacteroidota bacterium]